MQYNKQFLETEAQDDFQIETGYDETNVNEAEETGDSFALDPFIPLNGIERSKEQILTLRAIVVGISCGCLISASNIYMGLKSGWAASASLFASIVGFTLLKTPPGALKYAQIMKQEFGPQENNIVQTIATASSGMTTIFTSAIPAMYQLGLLNSPEKDFWKLVTLTATGGFWGFFCSTPLRNLFILLVAKDLHLIFPTASATAITIRNMHQAVGTSSRRPQQKIKVLGRSFVFAVSFRVVSQYAKGLLWEWHPFTWLLSVMPSSNTAVSLESWGWFIEWSPAFVGTGFLVGLNVAISYFLGTFLAWGVIGPLLVSYEIAFGRNEPNNSLVSYFEMSDEFTNAIHPSPRYWLLWPGISCMVVVSLTELCCQWRAILSCMTSLYRCLWKLALLICPNITRSGLSGQTPLRTTNIGVVDLEDDLVTISMWLPGLVVTATFGFIVLKMQYNMPAQEIVLAFTLAFLFSFLAVQATGATDITPLSAASTSSQVLLGAEAASQGLQLADAQRLSLLGGALSAIGASQAAGFLLKTSPRKQWLAQGIGTIFASITAPTFYTLFASAYPCINEASTTSCTFQVPTASVWRATAMAATNPSSEIPRSSIMFAFIMSTLGALSVIIRHCLWTGKWSQMRHYHPNMIILSLGFVIPSTIYATAILLGALLAVYWSKQNNHSYELYRYAVAAGWIAGEGIGGIINAVLQIFGLSGDVFGLSIGCPGGACS